MKTSSDKRDKSPQFSQIVKHHLTANEFSNAYKISHKGLLGLLLICDNFIKRGCYTSYFSVYKHIYPMTSGSTYNDYRKIINRMVGYGLLTFDSSGSAKKYYPTKVGLETVKAYFYK